MGNIVLNKEVKISELYEQIPDHLEPLFRGYEYPWEILPYIKEFALQLVGCCGGGYRVPIEGVAVGEDVKIYSGAVIEPPAVIGAGCEIRPGAFIRGGVIAGEGCVIGNSTELKNCILLDGVQVPHYNYVGDSVLGRKTHLGAGSICSNLRSDGRSVVIRADREHDTGLRKVGAFLGDGADVGCGCVLNPGTVIGKGTVVYPGSTLRGVFPEGSIVKTQTIVVKKRDK